MADKKLNSVSSVTDAAYVYAETSNGETVKISKADLASVVAELLPQGTLGIRRFSATLSAGQTYTLEGCQRGLYIYQDISASHVIGASLIQADGSCSEIVSIPYIKPKETVGVLYFKKESTSSPVAIHNGYSNLQGIVITYIALS